MNLFDVVDREQYEAELNGGYIRVSPPSEHDLRVVCYTQKAVFENRWNDVTRRCRGLVIARQNQIAAWCMPKFCNASEHIDGRPYAPPLPNEPFQVFSKVDGSLGTVFHRDGRWLVATKGGFGSAQAKWAQAWLDDHDLSELNPHNTYTTEIVYPENRIVVDNGELETLTLLAVFGDDGHEKSLNGYSQAWERLGGTAVQEWPAANLSRILFFAQRNQRIDGSDTTGSQSEGYVLRYRSGLRVKVKFADYIRLHGLVTGLTERHVWELLREGRSLDSLLEVLPDEYHDWLKDTAASLRSKFVLQAHVNLYALRINFTADPREFAEATRQMALPNLMAIYDCIASRVWDSVKPEAIGPWKDHE